MVTVYSKPNCPQCTDTKSMLTRLEVAYEEIDMTRDPAAMKMVMSLGHRSAPVVMTEDGRSWAGFKRDKIESLVSVDDMDSVFA